MNEPIDLPPPPAATRYTLGDYVFQFITITAGVLIALLVNGLVQWNADRELVGEARATIRREIAANLEELEGLPEAMKTSRADLGNASTMANELLASGKTEVRSVRLNFNLATLNASGWHSAERTGALGHMDYDEVQRYSELYSLQQLFDEQQRKAVDLLATASALIANAFDSARAKTQDVANFREQLMLLQANLMVTEQLGDQLTKAYRTFLQE